jgi:hypothetical protein
MPDRIVTIARVSTSIPLTVRLPITIAQEIQWRMFDGGPLRAVQKQIGAMSSRLGLLLDAHGESQTHSVNLRRCRLDVPAYPSVGRRQIWEDQL